jgi:hypothetical protein
MVIMYNISVLTLVFDDGYNNQSEVEIFYKYFVKDKC